MIEAGCHRNSRAALRPVGKMEWQPKAWQRWPLLSGGAEFAVARSCFSSSVVAGLVRFAGCKARSSWRRHCRRRPPPCGKNRVRRPHKAAPRAVFACWELVRTEQGWDCPNPFARGARDFGACIRSRCFRNLRLTSDRWSSNMPCALKGASGEIRVY